MYEIRDTQNTENPEYGVLTVGDLDGGIWPLTFKPCRRGESWPLELDKGTFEFKRVDSSEFPANGATRTSRMSLSTFPATSDDGPVLPCQADPGPCQITNSEGDLILVGILDGEGPSYVYSNQGLIQREGYSWPITLENDDFATLALSDATTPGEVQQRANEEFGSEQVTRSLYERTP